MIKLQQSGEKLWALSVSLLAILGKAASEIILIRRQQLSNEMNLDRAVLYCALKAALSSLDSHHK